MCANRREPLGVAMETQTLNGKFLGPRSHLNLGLVEYKKGVSPTPRVLSLLSSLLERTIQKNERSFKASGGRDVITIFNGSRAPGLSIRQYIERIFKYSSCSPSCFVVAYIYLDRFLQEKNVRLTSLNAHRLVITSVMLAAKFLDDKCYDNKYYAKVGGVSTAEMNNLEVKFLFDIHFRLHVTLETFNSYCLLLESYNKGCD
ncbi:Cyclin-P3-1 [Camellia lanceoleosa]|uniref:Cyclin-P3-1 n=1 Tax=Camellia lanceoleosa TaxID=1840588 RepID=A0ACC0IVC3_9ERIC|nr:Cyclin-P3-1 [Camellia lanceoleosa]